MDLTSTHRVLVARFLNPSDAKGEVMHVPLPVSLWDAEYDVFVAGGKSTVAHLVLITDYATRDYVSVSLAGNGKVQVHL